MATAGKNLSQYSKEELPQGADFKVGIVVSEWNRDITDKLLEGAKQTFLDAGLKPSNIIVNYVPGAFELPLGAQLMFEKTDIDGLVAIGVVIQGETRHFDFVCNAATNGLMEVNLKFSKPTAFCLLTDNTKQQSIDRAGGKHGNKGVECAVACLKMIVMKKGKNIQ